MDATLYQDQTKLAIFVLKQYCQIVTAVTVLLWDIATIQQMNGYIYHLDNRHPLQLSKYTVTTMVNYFPWPKMTGYTLKFIFYKLDLLIY